MLSTPIIPDGATRFTTTNVSGTFNGYYFELNLIESVAEKYAASIGWKSLDTFVSTVFAGFIEFGFYWISFIPHQLEIRLFKQNILFFFNK